MNRMNKAKKVAAIVTTFKRGEKIKMTVDSILGQSVSVDKLLVVDDGSSDFSHLTKITDKRLSVKRFKSNKGVVWARNYGIGELLDYEYLLFVDDDIVLDSNCLKELLKTIDEPNTVASMPTVYFLSQKDRVWSAGSGVDLLTGKTMFYVQKPGVSNSIEAATSIILVKTSQIKKYGWYDPIYYFCYEDADFYYRLRSGGGKILCSPKAVSYHDIPTSLSLDRVTKRSYHIARGRVFFLSRFSYFFPLNLLFVLGFGIYYQFLGIKYKDYFSGLRYIQGVVDGLMLVFRYSNNKYSTRLKPHLTEEDMFSPPYLRSIKVRQ